MSLVYSKVTSVAGAKGAKCFVLKLGIPKLNYFKLLMDSDWMSFNSSYCIVSKDLRSQFASKK